MFKRILMFVAVLAVIVATSANAAGIGTLVPNMPKMIKIVRAIEAYDNLKPFPERVILLRKSAVNTMSGDAIEFPAELLPDVSMYSSGYQVYLSLSGPFPPADSVVEFDHRVEVYGTSPINHEFAWLKTIPVGQESAQDRWWLDTSAPSRFDVNREIGAIIEPGAHSFRIKVPYTANDGGITLVYDFQYEVGEFVFWTMACRQDDRVGLDIFIKTLFPVVVGETYVYVRVDGWSNGYGTLDVTEYSSDEWPLYSIVSLASSAQYEHELFDTQRDITLNILGREVTVAQEFFAPYDFLPACETGGGKGKQ